jgi:hypothetical protein
VIERTGVACAASGKSGGFLALDWCDSSPLEPLARRSFELHARLPKEIGGDWGYRRMEAYGGTYRRAERARDRQRNARVEWVADGVAIGSQIGTSETTAQVDPGRFTRALMQAASRQGAGPGSATCKLHRVRPSSPQTRGVPLASRSGVLFPCRLTLQPLRSRLREECGTDAACIEESYVADIGLIRMALPTAAPRRAAGIGLRTRAGRTGAGAGSRRPRRDRRDADRVPRLRRLPRDDGVARRHLLDGGDRVGCGAALRRHLERVAAPRGRPRLQLRDRALQRHGGRVRCLRR